MRDVLLEAAYLVNGRVVPLLERSESISVYPLGRLMALLPHLGFSPSAVDLLMGSVLDGSSVYP
jgi:hypothetical protein